MMLLGCTQDVLSSSPDKKDSFAPSYSFTGGSYYDVCDKVDHIVIINDRGEQDVLQLPVYCTHWMGDRGDPAPDLYESQENVFAPRDPDYNLQFEVDKKSR